MVRRAAYRDKEEVAVVGSGRGERVVVAHEHRLELAPAACERAERVRVGQVARAGVGGKQRFVRWQHVAAPERRVVRRPLRHKHCRESAERGRQHTEQCAERQRKHAAPPRHGASRRGVDSSFGTR